MPEPPAESLAWVHGAAKVKRLALPVGLLVGVTAISGAFVAGNDAVRNFSVYFNIFFPKHASRSFMVSFSAINKIR